MMESTVEGGENRPQTRPSAELSKLIDWLTAGFLVLAGLLTTAIGVAVYTLVDRELIAEAVAEGTITSPQLTDAELIDVSVALSTWGGVATALAGLLLVVGGVGFISSRRRLHSRDRADRALPDSTTLAIIGAVVTAVTSFVPLSPVLGGIVAGYLEAGDDWDGIRIGAYAGALTAAPVVLLLLFVLGGLVISTIEIGAAGAGIVIGLIVLFSLLFSVGVLVGLSALGGYVGTRLFEHRGRTA